MTLVFNIERDQGVETRVYKDILPAENPDDRAYAGILKKIYPYTMTARNGVDSTYSLFQAVQYIVRNRIPGAIAECGVWRGGSMMLVAWALQHFGDTGRELYLYDTFAGMTEPEAIDIDSDGQSMKPFWAQHQAAGKKMGFGGSVEDVKANLGQTGYPEKQVHLIAGDVLETIPAQAPEQVALLRLDTDWYKSTLHELTHLYGRLAPNGVLVIDDYGWCKGARQATDEFFQSQPFKPLMNRVDQSVRVIIKPAL